jgi:LPXTG-motif cell wall-anchored protein
VQFTQNQISGSSDDTASFAIMWVSGCDPGRSSTIVFEDKENTGGSNAGGPDLLLTASDANAVSLLSFHAADQTANWPLYLGLAALAVLIVGLLVYRRRAVAR